MENKLVNVETGEIANTGEIVKERTDSYEIVQKPDGKFVKKMFYKRIWTKTPATQEEQIELYKVFNDSENNEDLVTPFSNIKNQVIEIHHFFTNPYESFNEDTGETEFGVVTTIYDGKKYYSTSSKSVYHTLMQMEKVFGNPADKDYKPIKVKVIGTKRENGVQINISLVGIAE